MKKITIAVLAVISLEAGIIEKHSGPTHPYIADFPNSLVNYPSRASGYNDPHTDRMFLETFQIPKSCRVKRASLTLIVKKNGSNDSYGVVSNRNTLLSQHVNNGTNQINLSSNIINTMNSTHRFSFYVEDDTTVRRAKLRYNCAGSDDRKKGMTWKKYNSHQVTGVVHVGCGNGNQKCDPYHGDRPCSMKLPILCKYDRVNFPKPTTLPQGSRYNRWSHELVATTKPISPAGANLTNITKANKVCEKEFGIGWKVAEFHDGAGWTFWAYGNSGRMKKRFWVDINDQPNGTCWSH